MRFTFAIATILAVAYADDRVDLPFHSKPWICTHVMKTIYDDKILNGVATPGVDCFDELLALPDKIKDKTPIKTYLNYMVIGPYIGKSKASRFVQVAEKELEHIDLGKKMKGKFAVECLKCYSRKYDNNVEVSSCNDLTMEECPERLSKEIYWNPPGNITASSDAEFCMYRNENDIDEYLCTVLDANLDVMP
ncbi:uncharacterized protein [Ptychodera flava]|uniref:uncharacterized protein n=1 Tax=Ptychodera flava TaxID=63121 RepID=UPI00396A7284